MVLQNIFLAGLATCMVHQVVASPKPSNFNPCGCSSPYIPSLPFPNIPPCSPIPPSLPSLPLLSLPYQQPCQPQYAPPCQPLPPCAPALPLPCQSSCEQYSPSCPPLPPCLPALPSITCESSCEQCSSPCPPTLPCLPFLPSFPLTSCRSRRKSFCPSPYLPPFLPQLPSFPLATPYQSSFSPLCPTSFFPSYPQSCSYLPIPQSSQIPYQRKCCNQQQSVTIPNIILALLPPTAKPCGCEKSCSFGPSYASPFPYGSYGPLGSNSYCGCGNQPIFVPIPSQPCSSVPYCDDCC